MRDENTNRKTTSPLIIDLFAGGGGASQAIFEAMGRHPDIAVNHDPEALALHAANHAETLHLCDDIRQVDIEALMARFENREVELLWASPDCTHHSKARGAKPKDKKIRGLAWEVLRWSAAIKRTTGALPRMIALENVEEFADWGPIHRYGKKAGTANGRRKGETFRIWQSSLRSLGFRQIEQRELVACDYGAPTSRKRLFLVARSDGQPINWPKPTHMKPLKSADLFTPNLPPFRDAASILQWDIPLHSIFDRKRALKPKTCARIAKGIRRYLIETAQPFVVPITHSGPRRIRTIDEPLATITSCHRGEFSLAAPFIDKYYATGVAADATEPLDTMTAKGRFGLAGAFLEQANTGLIGHSAKEPLSTITSKGAQQRLVLANLSASAEDRSKKRAAVLHFLWEHFGHPTEEESRDPEGTLLGRLKFGLVYVDGRLHQIWDIGMRMLTPRELYSAQGFPADYKIAVETPKGQLTKTAQIRMVGNSVSPPPASALLKVNLYKARHDTTTIAA